MKTMVNFPKITKNGVMQRSLGLINNYLEDFKILAVGKNILNYP
jgi:hypothetical protein